MQDWLTLSENRMIWQTIRGRIIPFFWSNPIGHHVDLLLILLTRNKLSHSWSMFVNNMSHHQHLKNRYIIKLAIKIDKAFSIFRTSLRQSFSLKKTFSCTILLDDFFFTQYTLFSSEEKYQLLLPMTIYVITQCTKQLTLENNSYFMNNTYEHSN